jgi:hypothetical protein
LAKEILPLLRSRAVDETPESLRRLVALSESDYRALRKKLGVMPAQLALAKRAAVLAELNNLLRLKGIENDII